jgi:hypothetical protein
MRIGDVRDVRDAADVTEAYHRLWEGKIPVDEATHLRVLAETVVALEAGEVPHVVTGGIGLATWGRPRWTHDVDVFIRPEDAPRALKALAGAGFVTQETYLDGLHKAIKDGVLIDVVVRSPGGIYLDDEMLARAGVEEFAGQPIRVITPEDLVVIKALLHNEERPRHWHDALGIISTRELDWDYLVRRARQHGARRVLSLLLYAQSSDLVVPDAAIKALFHAIFGPFPLAYPDRP